MIPVCTLRPGIQSAIHAGNDLLPGLCAACCCCSALNAVHLIILQNRLLPVCPHPPGELLISVFHSVREFIASAHMLVERPVRPLAAGGAEECAAAPAAPQQPARPPTVFCKHVRQFLISLPGSYFDLWADGLGSRTESREGCSTHLSHSFHLPHSFASAWSLANIIRYVLPLVEHRRRTEGVERRESNGPRMRWCFLLLQVEQSRHAAATASTSLDTRSGTKAKLV